MAGVAVAVVSENVNLAHIESAPGGRECSRTPVSREDHERSGLGPCHAHAGHRLLCITDHVLNGEGQIREGQMQPCGRGHESRNTGAPARGRLVDGHLVDIVLAQNVACDRCVLSFQGVEVVEGQVMKLTCQRVIDD